MTKKIAYLSVLTSLIGASLISIDLGAFQLSIFRIIIILMCLAMFIKIFKRNSIIVFNRSENSFSIYFMILWLIYAMATLGWVKDYGAWIRAVYFLTLGVMCVVFYSRIFKSTDDILKAFRIIELMIVFHNLIGWYEIITDNYLFLSNSEIKYSRYDYPVSMFGNTNDFALFMLGSIFISYVCAVNTNKAIIKIICFGTMISSTLLLIMTTSRANILGLIMSLVAFVYLSMRKKHLKKVIIIILALILTLFLFIPDGLSSITTKIDQNLIFTFSASTNSESVRINLIKNGLEFLIKTFGFGTGAGNAPYWIDSFGTYYTAGITGMHNWWMEILTEYGIVVFLLYIIFYLKLFKSTYRIFRSSKNRQDISISLCCICFMIGFVIGSISSSSNFNNEWLWMFWGLLIAFQGVPRHNKINDIELQRISIVSHSTI